MRTGLRLLVGIAVVAGCCGGGNRAAAAGVPDGQLALVISGAFASPVTVLGAGSIPYTSSGRSTVGSDQGSADIGACGWSSSGTYNASACMTGVLTAPLSSTTVTSSTGDIDNYALTIVMVAGIGVVSGSLHEDGSFAPSASVRGVALLVPRPTENCVTGVTDFEATVGLQALPLVLP